MTTQTAIRVRVWVEDVWDTVELSADADWTVARLKDSAATAAGASRDSRDRSEVKFRGALILDERVTLRELNVPDNAAFIVLSSRRRPVR